MQAASGEDVLNQTDIQRKREEKHIGLSELVKEQNILVITERQCHNDNPGTIGEVQENVWKCAEGAMRLNAKIAVTGMMTYNALRCSFVMTAGQIWQTVTGIQP